MQYSSSAIDFFFFIIKISIDRRMLSLTAFGNEKKKNQHIKKDLENKSKDESYSHIVHIDITVKK